MIMYRLGVTNYADALIRREQDLNNQMAIKSSLWTQAMLQLEYFDPQIQAKLNTNPANAKICPINTIELDFINKLLQANYTALSLQEYHEKAKNKTGL